MSLAGERRRFYKKEARFFLFHNYLNQIFMTAIFVLISFGINALKLNLIEFFGLEYSINSLPVEMVFDLILFSIAVPLLFGMICVEVKLFEGENVGIAGMFTYFSSAGSLFECYRFTVSIIIRFAAFFVPFALFGFLIRKLSEFFGSVLYGINDAEIVMVLVCIIYITAFLLVLLYMMRYTAVLYIYTKSPYLDTSEIIKKSAGMMSRKKTETFFICCGFLAWIIISVYFSGILLVFFTIPYILLTYAVFMSSLLAEKGGEQYLNPAADYIDPEPDDISNEKIKTKNKRDLSGTMINNLNEQKTNESVKKIQR